MTYPGSLSVNPAFTALRNRVDMLERRAAAAVQTANQASAVAAAGVTTSAKRFRIGIFTVPLTVLGAQVQGTVKWSTPITNARGQLVDDYNVDAACSAMGTSLIPTISAQTSAGVTVSFTAPVLLAAGTVVVVLGIAPATNS